jgi:MHS family proline/betaine transporter-like MFS transporter
MKTKNFFILATTIGTIVEWSEFICYGYLAPKLAKLFFSINQPYALVFTFAIFAISYLARPLGAILFGYIGDRFGRKISLFYSMLFMGLSTLIIAVTPTYNQIGVLATFILIVSRLIQGMTVAGEFTGSAIFIMEHYKGKYPTLAVSWVSFASALGMALGSAIASAVSIAHLPAWSWRIPFLFGFIGCLFGLIFRIFTTETADFKQLRDCKSVQLSMIQFHKILLSYFWHYKINFIRAVTIAAFVGVYIYICNIWWVSYISNEILYKVQIGQICAFYGNMAVVMCTPILAFLVDYLRLNYKKIMRLGLLLSCISVPLMFFITKHEHNFYGFLLVQTIYALNNVLVTATMFRYLVSIFSINARYFTLALSWSIAVAIFGGTAPLVAQIIVTNFSNISLIVIYVVFLGIISAIII